MESKIVKNKIVRNVKNTVIGFFVLVFIMGFFSKSIINLFLPKVMVELASEGAVQRTLNVGGMVEAKNNFQVRLPGEAIIEEFLVKVGDKVEEGKPLFRINTAYGLRGNEAEIQRLKLDAEAARLRITNLRQGSDELELKNILSMKAKLAKSIEELAGQQALFDAGAISKQELDNYKSGIEQQEQSIETAKLQLGERKRQDLAAIKELEGQVKGIELQISELESKQDFYSSIDEEGICHAKTSGIVTNISQAKSILPRDTVIVDIADTGKNAGLIYVADIMENDYELVKEAGSIQVNAQDPVKSEFLEIRSISRQNDRGQYRVEAAIPENAKTADGEAKYRVGQSLEGVVKQKYTVKGAYKVSKSAVIVFGEYKVGNEGTVYLLEESEGVLGKEFRAKEVPVKLLAIGDNDVVVSELEKYEKPEVILNLSYKIRDGVKVFLWP